MDSKQIGASPGFTFAYYQLDSTIDNFLWSLDALAQLGYENFGLETLEPEHTRLYWENDGIHRLLQRAEIRGIRFTSFTIWHCVTALCSCDSATRSLGVKRFAEGVEIAKRLGIELVTIGSDWPSEWVTEYRPEYQHGPAGSYFIPSTREYEQTWCGYVDAIGECLEIACRNNQRLAVEPRANSLIATADGFLRMWDRFRAAELGCGLDVMHCSFQRESVPVAIQKLGPQLAVFQVSGTDGTTLHHLPLSSADETLRASIAALRATGFTGPVDVELYGMPVETVNEAYRRAREVLLAL